jgi:predicted outer membrane protein
LLIIKEVRTGQYIKKTIKKLTIVVLLSFVTTSCNIEQKNENLKKEFEEYTNSESKNIITKNDSNFLIYATEINIEEVILSQLVQQNTQNEDVLELAKIIENSHNNLSKDLSILASNKKIKIPTIPTTKINDEYKLLSNKSGDDFDKTYCEMIIVIQRDAIKAFDEISNETMDSQIRILAYDTLINLRLNLDNAIKCKTLIK